ncbi:electron transport complex subunit E [Alkalilimnicola sp. S0819]|uniref:electron transport complex subunit E n=1 Tax=Alkalilimnicola sp. S0819 TaxID=2613922 RepID=UPI0012623295|nr:electron transport complex subunit E [Alkalilimnicola sp. S0819]KAB7623196.1 electron transport complex subunit E [Alkalilimnicola sp. S0819]MPQ17042.1 RnfABCDGE type electron transport complex subunit E [Alkalilimnicola sp. S0819]
MSANAYGQIVRDGLWNNNVGLVQLLGLCPLLAVSATVVNGLALGLATLLTLVASNLAVSLIRNIVRPEVRIPVFVLIIASIVTAIELAMNAWFHQLYLILGIFIPLIVTNCSILGRAEAFASRNKPLAAALDGFMMGLGFALLLVVLGALRELLGQGTLLAQAHLMLGEWGRGLTLTVLDDYRGFLLAVLPPGAFIGLGLLLALKNSIDKRLAARAARAPAAEPEAGPEAAPGQA